ncbi:hypothetical protein SAMN05421752_104187 [Natronorubrum thiooxidans]|uniref:Uncharacterized protein n=2 Tax=Natronorubrum thiooxidans TaxID=308853 RepID=A0A1N7EKB7_9EURY|nr:hypothetical protein SAMN05421752_104187 [Natronorubrum thiooxidans]
MAVTLIPYQLLSPAVKKFRKLKSCDYVISQKESMTDSTINTNSSEGALDVGATTDDLFGEIEEGVPEGEPVDGGSTGTEEPADDEPEPSDGGVEDQTAATVFGNLQKNGSTADDIDDVLDNESPEDIIASADEPEPEPADDELLVDEGALEELLLTDRTKDQEFLWIDADDTDESAETPADTAASSETDAVDASTTDADGELSTDDPVESTADTDAPESASSDDAPDEHAAEAAVADEHEKTETPLETESDVEPDAESDVEPDSQPDIETSETTELALADDEHTAVPATTDDDDTTTGVLGWLRAKLGGLFS